MITKTAAVKMSIRKWEGIVNGGEEEEFHCGFCYFREQLNQLPLCGVWCPLSKARLCMNEGKGIYFQWKYEINEEKRIELAQQMLDGIKKYGNLWTQGKKED